MFNNLPEKQAKIICNSFIGNFGRKYDYTNNGFTCTEYETAMNCWVLAMAENKNISIDHYNNTYLIKEQKIDRIFSDNTSINRFVISMSILKLLLLIEEYHGDDSKLISYNTDGTYITNSKTTFKNKKDVKFKTKHIGKAFMTDDKPKYFEKHYITLRKHELQRL